jgi:glucosyl-dolichyl phosphate glucuronosyltransferase
VISVIVCTYNRSQIIIECLNSIISCEMPECEVEIIVIDNNSTDDTVEVVSNFIQLNKNFNISLFSEKRQGLSIAKNRGINESRGELIIFLDDDAIVTQKWLMTYHRNYKNNAIQCMGGKILPWLRDSAYSFPQWFNTSLWGMLSMLDMGDEKKIVTYPDFPYGGNFAVSKNVFMKVGEFDETFGRKKKSLISNEEMDFMLRLKQAEIPVYYIPDAIIYHLVQQERLKISFFIKRNFAQGVSDSQLFFHNWGLRYLISTISQRLWEFLWTPFVFFKKIATRSCYAKPLFRFFYNAGYIKTAFSFLCDEIIRGFKIKNSTK